MLTKVMEFELSDEKQTTQNLHVRSCLRMDDLQLVLMENEIWVMEKIL